VGLIVNIRDNHAKVHRVRCESVEVMSASKYPKIFSTSTAGVTAWLTAHPEGTWDYCGVCGGGTGT
jgi:hypothetical protein